MRKPLTTDRDDLIRLAAIERVAAQSQWMDVSRLKVDVSDGVIRLSGELDQRSEAEGLAWDLLRLGSVTGVSLSDLRFGDDGVRGLRLPGQPAE